MFGSKPTDQLERLMDEANQRATRRAGLLAAIERQKTVLEENQQALAAANRRVTEEEFQAAQTEGGVAIASQPAQRAVGDASLQVKSAMLRLQGLGAELSKAEDALAACWADLREFSDGFQRQILAGLRAEWEQLLDSLLALVKKTWALDVCGKLDGFGPMSALKSMRISDPTERGAGKGGWFLDGVFLQRGGEKHLFFKEDHWRTEPAALQLEAAIKAVEQRVAPIGALVAEFRPEAVKPRRAALAATGAAPEQPE